jgi:6-phosphogluconolactonase
MDFVAYPDREALALSLATRIAGELTEAIELSGRATLSVPGGSTPGPVFDTLSAADLDWARVAVLLHDERWVPESSDRSNTRLLRQRLLVGRAAAARLVPLHVETETPEQGLDRVMAGVEDALPISVLLLGMGEDLHTASLFPRADHLGAALADDAPAVMAMRAPGAPEPRITLTAPVLRAATHLHVLITGPGKKAALERAQAATTTEEAPIRCVLDQATVHWAD